VLHRCEQAHVVLQFVRCERDDADLDGRPFHQQAACAGVAEAHRRWASNVGHDTVGWQAEQFEVSALRGRRISVQELLGPGLSDDPLQNLGAWLESKEHEGFGFAYAFCFPPYGLQSRPGAPLGDAPLETLFADVWRHVLGDPNAQTEIWSWNTEWSPYFDDGREWWGTGLWTVDVDGAAVVVLASATD